MSDDPDFFEQQRRSLRSQTVRKAAALLAIESNPATEAELAMIDRFEARGLSVEERKAEIAASIARDFGISSAN